MGSRVSLTSPTIHSHRNRRGSGWVVFADHCGVVPFGKVLFQDMNPKGGKAEISDHLPLWAEFSVNKLTQELDAAIGG